MDDFTQKLLDYIVKYTWHVLLPDGNVAKIPYQVFHAYDRSKRKTDKALEELRERKLITGYSFSSNRIGLRATAKGNTASRVGFSRRDEKRVLIIKGSTLELMEFDDWVHSREDVSFSTCSTNPIKKDTNNKIGDNTHE
jgi:hypothetical protein